MLVGTLGGAAVREGERERGREEERLLTAPCARAVSREGRREREDW